MLKELSKGFEDGADIIDRLLGMVKETDEPPAVTDEVVSYRICWLFYISPDFVVAPERRPVFSKFHSSAQRVPEILVETLEVFSAGLEGLFPEPISASEDLGYAVFSDRYAALAALDQLKLRLDGIFADAGSEFAYQYAEFELSECAGALTLPATVAKREILANFGIDAVVVKHEAFDHDYSEKVF